MVVATPLSLLQSDPAVPVLVAKQSLESFSNLQFSCSKVRAALDLSPRRWGLPTWLYLGQQLQAKARTVWDLLRASIYKSVQKKEAPGWGFGVL